MYITGEFQKKIVFVDN